MDFITTHDAPFPITIDGTAYQIPRFLGPALAAWAAETEQKTKAEAIAVLKESHDKARFLLFFQAPPVDVGRQLRDAATAEGSQYVVRKQMKAGGVPDDVIEKVIAKSDPVLVSNLAQELTMLASTAPKVDALAGADGGADPLSKPPTPSGVGASSGGDLPAVSTPPTETTASA